MRILRTAAAFITCAAALWLLSGCGGGGGAQPSASPAAGTLAVTVRFPAAQPAARPQSLPHATNSVRFRVLDATGTTDIIAPVIVNRDPSQATVTIQIRDIPAGPVMLRAEAYDQAAGAGTLVAQAQVSVTVVAQETVSVKLVSDRLPVQVAITGPASLERGTHQAYSAAALDADGEVVLGATLDPWQSATPGVLSVTDAGLAAAIVAGTSELSIIAHYAGDTWTGRLTVQVFERLPVTVQVTPPALSLAVGQKAPVEARALDGNGNLIPYATITWASQDETVAIVTTPATPPEPPGSTATTAQSGISGAIVTGVGSGITDVVATAQTAAGEATGACHVTVTGTDG